MLKYDKSNSYPVFQVKTGLFINQMFTKGENRLYMNQARKRYHENIITDSLYQPADAGRSFRTFAGGGESFGERTGGSGVSG